MSSQQQRTPLPVESPRRYTYTSLVSQAHVGLHKGRSTLSSLPQLTSFNTSYANKSRYCTCNCVVCILTTPTLLTAHPLEPESAYRSTTSHSASYRMADDSVPDAIRDAEVDSDEDVAPHAPNTLIERRRAQKRIFERWLVSDAGLEALKPKAKTSKGDKDEADEVLSIQSLMAKQGQQIVKNPRQYQLELFQRARKQNTIAVLDTGSGKTLIAVLLLKWIIDEELERRAAGRTPKISFFLVASVTLVYQQHSVLETNLAHPVARVCGADNVDNWHKDRWLNLFSDHKVIVATADVLHQCLAHSYLRMDQINLLIFDEAHHAKKNHAYARSV